MKRQFILRAPEHKDALLRFIDQNWHAMSRTDKPMSVTCAEHKQSRKDEANSAMWAGILQPMAEQAYIGGRRFSAEVWHEHCKREFLPEEAGDATLAHYRKWDYLPDGSRVLVGSTTQLTKRGFSEYMAQLEAYAVEELGVRLPAAPNTF